MVDTKQQVTQGFYPGSGRGGRTSSRGVLTALYCSAPGVPVVGLLQARRERKRIFQVPGGVAEDVVGELESECTAYVKGSWSVALSVLLFCVFPPPWLGIRPPFIDQGGGELHACRTI
jgi:hypothetical protein